MCAEPDMELAQKITEELQGKFWSVNPGDWWVVVEGMTRQRLVILTNDPLGICFTPKEMTPYLTTLKQTVLEMLIGCGLVHEDGSWAPSAETAA